MSQSTFSHVNQSGLSFRQAINAAQQAIVSGNSGVTAPAETYPFLSWIDTSVNPALVRMRNISNSAWVVVAAIDPTYGWRPHYAGLPFGTAIWGDIGTAPYNVPQLGATGLMPSSLLPAFVGASAGSAGTTGLVSAPAAGYQNAAFRGGNVYRPVVDPLTAVDLSNGGGNNLNAVAFAIADGASVEAINVSFTNLSGTATAYTRLRIGTTTGYVTAGYTGQVGRTGVGAVTHGSGFIVSISASPGDLVHGIMHLQRTGPDVWAMSVLGGAETNIPSYGVGRVVTTGTLTAVALLIDTGFWDSGRAGGHLLRI